jgi:hypothetical protein
MMYINLTHFHVQFPVVLICNALCLSNKASICITTPPCFKMVSSSVRRYKFLAIFMMCYRTTFHKPYSNVLSIIAMKLLEVKYKGSDVLVARLMKSEFFGTWRSGVPRGEGSGVQTPPPSKFRRPSKKSCRTQPDCENC